MKDNARKKKKKKNTIRSNYVTLLFKIKIKVKKKNNFKKVNDNSKKIKKIKT